MNLDQLAQWIGYAFLIVGGPALAILATLWLVTAVMNLPLLRPKVLRIIKLGMRAWWDIRNGRVKICPDCPHPVVAHMEDGCHVHGCECKTECR